MTPPENITYSVATKLISEMNVKDGENILEVGCGTGRNLEILAKKHPKTNFFGLDASAGYARNRASKGREKEYPKHFA